MLAVWGLTDVRHRAEIDPARPEKHRTDLTAFTEAGAAMFERPEGANEGVLRQLTREVLDSGQSESQPVDAIHVRVVQGTVSGCVTPTHALDERALVRELVRSLQCQGTLRLHACHWDNGMRKTVDREYTASSPAATEC